LLLPTPLDGASHLHKGVDARALNAHGQRHELLRIHPSFSTRFRIRVGDDSSSLHTTRVTMAKRAQATWLCTRFRAAVADVAGAVAGEKRKPPRRGKAARGREAFPVVA
jgi:hypothetical protein